MPEAPAWKVRGKLPGLRWWRTRRGLTQTELAEIAGVTQNFLSRIERGQRGCDPEVAQKFAKALEVDLEELRAPQEEEGAPAAPKFTHSFLHKAYLKRILDKEVGSSYAPLAEDELERKCKRLSWEGVLEVISEKERELEYLREELGDPELPPELRRFYEEVVGRAPELDIRVLAAARGREPSERGKEALTRAMRELL